MPYTPQLNKIYAALLLAAGLAVAAMAAYAACYQAADGPTAMLLGGFAGLVPLGALSAVLSAGRLTLSASGVRRGRIYLRWDEIRQPVWIGYGLRLTDGRHSLTLAPWAYAEPEALLAYLSGRLPQLRPHEEGSPPAG